VTGEETGDPTGQVRQLVEEYIELRRGLGYRSRGPERLLRAFADRLDLAGHHGPIPLELSLEWAASTSSADPCNPARRLTVARGFLRHLAALDGATQVPPPSLLGPTGHRKPPHVYSDAEIATCYRPRPGCPRPVGCARTAMRPCSGCWPAPGCGSPRP
jgi:hypothetical protein